MTSICPMSQPLANPLHVKPKRP